MARFKDMPEDLLVLVFLMLDFFELLSVKTTCRRFRQLVSTPNFIRQYNDQAAGHHLWYYTYFYGGQLDQRPHRIAAVRRNSMRTLVVSLRGLDAGLVLELIGVWRNMLVFFHVESGFVLYDLWRGTPIRIDCPSIQEMINTEIRNTTRVIVRPGDDARYIVSCVHRMTQRRQLRPRLRFFSSSLYPLTAISRLIANLTPVVLEHPLRRVIAMPRQRLFAVVSIEDGHPVHFLRRWEEVFGEEFEREYAVLPNQVVGNMRYSAELVYSSEGFLAVVERYVVIGNPNRQTIARVKLFRIAPDLLGGYHYIGRVPEEHIPQEFMHFEESRLEVVEGSPTLTMKIRSRVGAPNRRRFVVFRYDPERQRWSAWRKRMTVIGGDCGATYGSVIRILPAV